jgi:integrase/recombinase XerD
MKINGNGQAKTLSNEELSLLFSLGFTNIRDKTLFGICLYTACRISEALSLMTTDFKGDTITFKISNIKGKLKTRIVDIQSALAEILAEYNPKPVSFFPGKHGVSQFLTRFAAHKILSAATRQVGIEGVSTHSFRRTALTQMSSAGVPLRHIQEISGHTDLGTLQRYLEVTPEQRRKAGAVIGLLI